MNYYPFHIGDYVSATRHLTWDEDMAYRRLIDAYYTRETPIPTEKRQAYRLVMATTQEQREAVDTILTEFFTETPDGWINSRCDAEILAFREKSDKASQSAQTRWRNAKAQQAESGRNADALSNQCERIETICEGNAPKTKTNTNISKPNGLDIGARKKKGSPLPDNFEPDATGIAYAEERGIAIDTEVENFRNWHQAKGSLMVNWQAAWRTWCGKARQFTKPAAGGTESFYERDQRLKAERMSAFTGKAPRQAGNVIDVTPSARLIGGAK